MITLVNIILPAALQGLPSLSLLAAWDYNLGLLEDKRNIEAEEEGRHCWRFYNYFDSEVGKVLISGGSRQGWNVSSLNHFHFP